jgi:hypothetical protein
MQVVCYTNTIFLQKLEPVDNFTKQKSCTEKLNHIMLPGL